MIRTYVILSVFTFAVLLGVPVMEAVSQASLLKVNEIELNPKGEIPGNQWIELYNPGSMLVDLSRYQIKSTNLLRTVELPNGYVIEPNSYLIIPFEIKVFNERNESIVFLTPDSVEIARTPILADIDDDDRTWQRFPNGIDTGSITDWHFRNSTFGVSNGAPEVKLNFTLSQPIFVDQQGNKVETFLEGSLVGVRSEVVNKFEDERSFAYIIQIKNDQGFTVSLGWIEDVIILSNRAIKPTLFWLAPSRGEYSVDIFIWRSMSITDPLAPSTSGLIRVAG